MNKKIKGIAASDGISIAKVFILKEKKIEITNLKIQDTNNEIKKVVNAIKNATMQIKSIKETTSKSLGSEETLIFDAHIQVANDPVIFEDIKYLIINSSYNALYATQEVANKYVQMFESMDDNYMKERAADIKDVSKRILNEIAGIKIIDLSTINEEVIIVAKDLTPSDTAQLNKKYVKGFLTNIGGKTSHAAIMARSLEIPAILGLNNITELVSDKDCIAMNGTSGDVIINPSNDEIKELNVESKLIAKKKDLDAQFFGKDSKTKNGYKVEIASNICSPKDVVGANNNDADGVGLFRSEFLYMDANDWPSEELQFKLYSKVLKEMGRKRVVVRTLDIGGDKTLKYYKFPKEMNPFLGCRAIRLSLDKKDIFQTQLRALLRASIYGKLAIMFPMIATIEEFLAAKEQVEIAKESLRKKSIEFLNDIEIGMMIEIPSAVVLSKKFAKHSDFFSIGTNDLIQYTMAADRMSENVSYLYQPLNPSILNLINMTIEGAHSEGKWVGMCGEMASDKNAIPLLLGMGLDEFSMSATSILPTRRLISNIDSNKAKELAQKALNKSTEKEVIELVKEFNKDNMIF